jgi:hypothetical protein
MKISSNDRCVHAQASWVYTVDIDTIFDFVARKVVEEDIQNAITL